MSSLATNISEHMQRWRATQMEKASAAGFETLEAYQAHLKAEQEAADAERAKLDRKCQIVELVTAAGIPGRHLEAIKAGATFRQHQTSAAEAIPPMLDRGGIVALIGTRGGGKTFLACKLLVEFIKANLRTARYCRVLDIFRDLKASFDRDARENEGDVIKRYAGYGLLIIDEAHERGGSDWELTQLVDLLDRRYAEKRPTILISNQTKAAFATAMGPSIISRLTEDGDCIELTGESVREVIRRDRGAK